MTVSNWTAVEARITLLKPALDNASRHMWNSPAVRAVYLEWLRTLHGMIRATVPLMTAAIERCLPLRDDPVAAPLGAYFAKHVREEWGHDIWAREDYVCAGGAAEDIDGFIPGPATAGLVGAQYYWIRHGHPVALAGHIAVLEGYPPSTTLAPELAARTGLPIEAFRTIARHSHLDVKHAEDVRRLIDGLPLTPPQLALVGLSAVHTAASLVDILGETELRANAKEVNSHV